MTRKDYVALAAAIKTARAEAFAAEPIMAIGTERAAYCIADTLAADNPRFDRARFLKAAGVA